MLETLDQDTAKIAAPKFRAIADYIRKNQLQTSLPEAPRPKPQFQLHPNYPNPFNPTTNLSFSLPAAAFVTMEIFTLSGQKVSTLLSEKRPAGTHTVAFDAGRLSSGLYMYQLTSEGMRLQRKMMLLK